MIRLLVILLLFSAPIFEVLFTQMAQAQPASSPTPEQQVLAQLAAEAWQREASLRVQVLTLQAELAAAKAKFTPDARSAPAPP
jgi:hypothetical protein